MSYLIAGTIKADETTEQWFDRELRPALLGLLDQVRQQAERERENTLRSVEHWLGNLHQRSASWSPETRKVVQVLADELRGRIARQ